MNPNKLVAVTFLLLAVASITLGAVAIMGVSTMQSIIASLAFTGMTMPAFFSTAITLGWVFGVLELLLGIAALISGIVLLTNKE